MPRQFYLETLGCPKNQVDSDKIVGTLLADGMTAADSAADADLVIVNTCAFIEEARQESIDTILSLSAVKRDGGRGGGHRMHGRALRRRARGRAARGRRGQRIRRAGDPRDASPAPRARVRSPQLAAAPGVGSLGVREDRRGLRPHLWVSARSPASAGLSAAARRSRSSTRSSSSVPRRSCSWRRTSPRTGKTSLTWAPAPSFPSSRRSPTAVPWVRLLYLYPSDLSDGLIDVIASGPVPYFDLSLQHVSKPLLRRMRRWGDGDRFLRRIDDIRTRRPDCRVPHELHRRVSRRDRGRPRPAAGVRRGGAARLVRLLRVLTRGGHLRR